VTPAEYEADSKGPIPWQCWDIPNFKSCATEAGHYTYRYLTEHSLKEGTPAWDELYPQVLRNKLYDCQISVGCAPSQLATTKSQAVPGSGTTPTPSNLSPSLMTGGDDKTKWYIAGAGVAAVVLFLLYKAKK